MKKTILALDELLNLLPDAVIVMDASGNIVFANRSIFDVLGYDPEELAGESLDCLIPENFRQEHRSHFAEFHQHGTATPMGERPLVYGMHRSGEEVPVSISIANIELDGERYSIAVMRDIEEIESEITQITHQAETDTLTGIANRLALSHTVEAAIAKNRPFALLYLDLEKFKPINDKHGHEVGDAVLQIVAKRLQAVIRSQDLAVRLGGDEFALFLDGQIDDAALKDRASAVAESIKRPFRVGQVADVVGVNIGSAQYPADGTSEAGLLRVADQNMYRAKQKGLPYVVSM